MDVDEPYKLKGGNELFPWLVLDQLGSLKETYLPACLLPVPASSLKDISTPTFPITSFQKMASSSGSQEQNPAFLEILNELDLLIAAAPHDYSSIRYSIRAFRNVLERFQQDQAPQNIQLGNPGELILNRMHQILNNTPR